MNKIYENILLINPGFINILFFRILNKGSIYIYENKNIITIHLLKLISPILKSLNIIQYDYKIGIGESGNGAINNLFKEAEEFTENYLDLSGDEYLLSKYNDVFKTKSFPIIWKRSVCDEVVSILRSFNGFVLNYSFPFRIYLSKNSKESLLAESFFRKNPYPKLKLKYYYFTPGRIEIIFGYFILIIFRIARDLLRFNRVNIRKFKIMLEASNVSLDRNRSFSLLEWWDEKKIKKKDILFMSFGSDEPGRKKGFKLARQMGFQCVSINEIRNVPIHNYPEILKVCIFLPLKLIRYLIKSHQVDFYLLALVDYYKWKKLYSLYNIEYFILPPNLLIKYKTIMSNYLLTKTIAISNSYHGDLENPEITYINANYFVTWGKGQTYYIKNSFGIDKIYYVGCYVLSYYKKHKKIETSVLSVNLIRGKKNIVFFDNKVIKDGSTPESHCLRYYDLMISVAERFDANIIFRTKDSDIFNEKYYYEYGKAKYYEKKIGGMRITHMSAGEYSVMSVLSLSDIVVYNRVGTPSMIALLLDLPTFCFCDKVVDTPDPIIKHYINEIAFEDPKILADQMEENLNGKKAPKLTKEHKQLLNHYLDMKGLERFRSKVSEIVNGSNC